MEPGALRRRFLWSFLVCLAITALMAIVAILEGGSGSEKWRIVASSALVSAASVCAMACAAFLERGRVPWLGRAGIALVAFALLLSLWAIWADPGRAWGRLAWVVSFWAVAVAHAELLWLPRLLPAHRFVQAIAVVVIGVLALLLSLMVYRCIDSDGVLELVAVVAIVDAALTVAVPILAKIASSRAGVATAAGLPEQLTLRRGVDGAWIDAEGGRYEVRRLDVTAP